MNDYLCYAVLIIFLNIFEYLLNFSRFDFLIPLPKTEISWNHIWRKKIIKLQSRNRMVIYLKKAKYILPWICICWLEDQRPVSIWICLLKFFIEIVNKKLLSPISDQIYDSRTYIYFFEKYIVKFQLSNGGRVWHIQNYLLITINTK